MEKNQNGENNIQKRGSPSLKELTKIYPLYRII